MLIVATSTALTIGAFAGTLLLGGVAGVLVDHLLSPSLDRWWGAAAARRALKRRRAYEYAGRPFEFEGVDVGLQVLFGTLGLAILPPDVQASLIEGPWRAPQHLRDDAARYADRFGFYDGEVGRLNRLDVTTYGGPRGAEHQRLVMEVMPTGFFDMLATNVALGPFTPRTAPLLRGREGLAETQLSNMMALDLTLITNDGHVPVFFRSARMAGLERCWQTSSGETVQLQSDVIDGRPDIFATARRGLHRELGIQPEELGRVALTAVVATPEFANIGLLMFAELNRSAAEFARSFNRYVMSAEENWEYSAHAMLPLDDAAELAGALTDPLRRWTKQAAASLIFAHAYRADGNVSRLAREITERGGLSLEAGSPRREVLSSNPSDVAAVAWHCWRCGSLLVHAPPTRCDACRQAQYANPKPCGEAVVMQDSRVLLVKRAREPWRGHWDLPGGFCEQREHPKDAARRELAEEVGLLGDPVDLIGIWMDDYEIDGRCDTTANVAYLVHLHDSRRPSLQRSEVADARWFPLGELPDDLAFPNHIRQVIDRAGEISSR